VLFLLADEGDLLSLAGEMLRLDCDRQELCLAESDFERRTLLRASEPTGLLSSFEDHDPVHA
jgi:hypothetical protein